MTDYEHVNKLILIFLGIAITIVTLRCKETVKECNCIKSLKIDRPNKISMDGLIIEIKLNDSLFNRFIDNKIYAYRPIHSMLTTFPFNFGTPEKVLNTSNKTVRIFQGTNLFQKFNQKGLDSLSKVLQNDLVMTFYDQDGKIWVVKKCDIIE